MTERVPSGLASTCIDPSSFEANECRAPPPLCDGVDASPTHHTEPPSPQASGALLVPWGHRFCREADTVVEGFLCNERVVVANACRKPKNAVDAYICDDQRMQALQKRVLEETFAILKSLLLQLFR